MNEENNQEEEYVEEEIEVYEEVEVDEEEEKNDSSLPKEKSINKINTIKSNSLLQNETDITEEKKENTNNNELQSLNDKIRYEEIENNTEKNNENFEKINTIIKNKENNNSEIKMNLFFDGGTEENKYLNLDYKIKTEKDSDELLNNNITPNKNKILEENNTNKELNFENNKNDNINSIRPQSNNFRSKIKRNNKKINKIDPNSNNNKINNFINTNLPQENNTNTQLLNSNNNKIELVNQNSNPIETQIKSSLINNQNDIKIKEEKKNMENIEESSKYNIINNNMSVNLEARKNSNEKNNIINNEENNEEKNKIINKKSQEEEKYENAISELCGNNEIIELFEIIINSKEKKNYSDEEINFIEICIKINIYFKLNNIKVSNILKNFKENHPLILNVKKILLKSFMVIKNIKEKNSLTNDLSDFKILMNDLNIFIIEKYSSDDVFLLINYILLNGNNLINSLNEIKNKNVSLYKKKDEVYNNYFEYTKLPKNNRNIRNVIFEINFNIKIEDDDDENEYFLNIQNNKINYKNLLHFVPYFSINDYLEKNIKKNEFLNEYLKYSKDLEKMFVLVKFINPLVNKIYSLTLKKSDLNLPLKNYLKEEDEIIFEKFSLAYKILTNKEFNKDCKLNFFIIDKTENNNNDENIINNIYKIYAENYNKILNNIKNKTNKKLFEKQISIQNANYEEDILKILSIYNFEEDENVKKIFKLKKNKNKNNN
jgi:hypothetical protein